MFCQQSPSQPVGIKISKLALRVLAIAGALVALANLDACTSSRNAAVFDAVWALTNENYYDRGFNGLDWSAVRNTYRPKAIAAKSSTELYWQVLNPMLSLLESSHSVATSPGQRAMPHSRNTSMEVMEPAWGRCAGLVATYGHRAIASKVIAVTPDSPLRKKGVEPGWRVIGMEAQHNSDPTPTKILFLAPNGASVAYDLTSPGAEVRKSIESFIEARLAHRDADTRFEIASLGISATLGRSPTPAIAAAIRPGSLADQAGIPPGAQILQISDTPQNDGQRLLAGRVRGSSSKDVSFSIRYRCDGSGPFRLPLAKQYANGVLELRFDRYTSTTATWLRHQIEVSHPRAIVLDLRENVGGSIDALRDVAGLFLSPGSVIGFVRSQGSQAPLSARGSSKSFAGPIAALISPVTASSAEVTANALRFHRRAILIGHPSAGEVVVARTYDLPDQGRLQVAIADFRGPDGTRLEGRGVTPDLDVSETRESVRRGRDQALQSAIKWLNSAAR